MMECVRVRRFCGVRLYSLEVGKPYVAPLQIRGLALR